MPYKSKNFALLNIKNVPINALPTYAKLTQLKQLFRDLQECRGLLVKVSFKEIDILIIIFLLPVPYYTFI